MTSTGTAPNRLVSSAFWLWGSQLATVVVQFAYAAVTSRLVAPTQFGEYSVALAVTALIVLVANGGLSQTVARLMDLDEAVIRSLVSLSLILGAVAALALWLTAPFWASLWGVPDADAPIRLLAVNAFTAPMLGVATGYTRRIGRFRQLAITTFTANCVGMALGLVAVALLRDSSSLLVSAIVSQILVLVVCVALSRGMLTRPGGLRAAGQELGFSARVLLTTVLAYLAGNVGKWGVSLGLGPAALGQLNRAEVLGWVPFQYAQDAMTQVVYPEFRHDRGSTERAQRVWADLLTLTAWIALPGAALAAALLPIVVPVLLGPRWSQAATLTTPLAVVGGLQIVVYVLYNALEAIGRFSSIWTAQVIQFLLNGAGAVAAISLHSFAPMMTALIVGLVVQHVVQLAHCRVAGYLRPSALVRRYTGVVAVAVAVFAVVRLVEYLVVQQPLAGASVPVAVAVLVAVGVLAWRFFHRLPPVRLAEEYGLLPGRLRRGTAA